MSRLLPPITPTVIDRKKKLIDLDKKEVELKKKIEEQNFKLSESLRLTASQEQKVLGLLAQYKELLSNIEVSSSLARQKSAEYEQLVFIGGQLVDKHLELIVQLSSQITETQTQLMSAKEEVKNQHEKIVQEEVRLSVKKRDMDIYIERLRRRWKEIDPDYTLIL